jgi:hypothetical protein
MNNLQIRKKYQAEKAFMTDNAAAFPAGSPGARTLTGLTAQIEQIVALAGTQVSGAVSQNVGIKDGFRFRSIF